MEITLVALAVAVATIVLAIAIAALILPAATQAGSAQAAPSEEKPRVASGSTDARTDRGAIAESAAKEPEPREPGPATSPRQANLGAGASSAAASSSAESAAHGDRPEVPCLRFYSADGLWLLRVLAVQRVVDLLLGQCSFSSQELADSLKRRIWGFLDDRPRFLATGAADGQARIFDVRTGRLLVSVRHDPGARRPLASVLLVPGPLLFTGTWDGRRHAWDAWPRKPGRPSEFARGERGIGQDNALMAIALSRDGKLLACACLAGCVLVYRSECPTIEVMVSEESELDELHESLKLGDHGDLYLKEGVTLAGVEIERHHTLLAEAGFEGGKSRRDVAKLQLPVALRFRFSGCLTRGHKQAWRRLEHEAAVLCLSLSEEGTKEFLYSGSRDLTLRKWELPGGACVSVYRGHSSMVRCLATNCRFLASGGDDRTVRIWRKDAAEALRTLTGHSDFVRSVALCRTFPERLVSAGDDLKVVLWDASTGERLRDFRQESAIAAVVLRGSLLLTSHEDGWARIWQVEDGTVKRQMRHPGAVSALSLL